MLRKCKDWMIIVLVATGVFGVGHPAIAEDLSELLSRIELLEAEMLEQQTQFASFSTGAEQTYAGGKSCGESCRCCPEPDCPAWLASYEATILQPYVSNRFDPGRFDNDYGVGHRLTFGRDGGDGVGVRARYWLYNTGHGTVPPSATALSIDMDVFDFEMTLDEELCNWDILVSGGGRYGRVGLDCACGTSSGSFEGFGPTMSLEATRTFGCRGLYLIGNARASLLVGDIDNVNNFLFDPAQRADIEDELVTVLENQLGLGWARLVGCSEVHFRAVWETQFWLNDTFNDDVGLASNLGFGGPTFAVEIRR